MLIEMTNQAAPSQLLKKFKCGCKTDCTRKTTHADNMELFVLTFASAAGNFPA